MISDQLVEKIISATNIKEGEIVLLHFWGEEEERPLLHSFRRAVLSLGATPMELMQSRTINQQLFKHAKETCFPESYFRIFYEVDVVIDICMYTPVRLNKNLEDGPMKIYRKYMGNLFQTLTQKKKFVQVRIPNKVYAIEEGIAEEIFLEKMVKAYDIDYNLLYKECMEKQSYLNTKKEIIIHTGKENILHLYTQNREWYVDAGEGDFPAGEVYIAPVEELSHGTIYFKEIWLDTDEKVSDVVLTIEHGKIVHASDEKMLEFIKELPPGGDIVAEFGLGMNPNVDVLVGYSALDEKMKGTLHIAIGMNTLFGGKNECIMHMDFVGFGEVEYR